MKLLNLDEIADFQNGYAFSSKEYVTQSTESKEVLRMGYIKRGGGFKEDDSKVFAPKESKGFTKKYMLEQDDIVIAMTDMKNDVKILGCCALVNHKSRFLLNQRVGRVRVKDTNLVNPKYLYYFLNSPDQLRDVRSRANSGVQVNLSTQSIKESLIKIYPKEYQDKIVEVLHSLDKKIELNQQINENLEEIAKTLFKSWFIDFDPVRAKAEGKPTGLSKGISDLFPDSFEDSELGEIPKGWRISNLGDTSFEIESGKRPKGGINQELKNGIPSVGAESISSLGSFDYSKEKFVTYEFFETCLKGRVKNYDVALYKDGGKPGLFMPRVAIYGDGFPYKEFLVNEHVFLLRSTELGQFFLYHLINSSLMMQQIIEKGSAKAAQPGLNQQEVKSCKFIFPPTSLVDEFNKIIDPSIKKQLILGIENRTLADLRDTLLPKLISGECKIPDVENLVEEAGI